MDLSNFLVSPVTTQPITTILIATNDKKHKKNLQNREPEVKSISGNPCNVLPWHELIELSLANLNLSSAGCICVVFLSVL
jgi:hypothetical protein